MFALFRSNPSFRGFSHADIAIEFSRHEAAFELDPATARREASMTIRSLKGTATELRLVLDTCQQILEADGVAHPQELAALTEIRAILRSSLAKRAAKDLSSANWAEGFQKLRDIGGRHA
jgi:tellurite resistance protein